MKKRVITLLLCLTMVLSACGNGEKSEEKGNQEVTGELSGPEEDFEDTEQSGSEQSLTEEERIINERTKQWFDDLNWDVSEDEKELLYQEFCEKRIPYEWTREFHEFDRADYYSIEDKGYICVSDEGSIRKEITPVFYNYSVTGDSFIYSGGENGNQLFYMEYDETVHYITEFDEKIGQISAQKDYCFLITESGKVYRVHYLSGHVDYVTTLISGTTYYVYDSKSILYFVESRDEVKVEHQGDIYGGHLEGYGYANYFDMETGQWEESPLSGEVYRVVQINFDVGRFDLSQSLYEEFCSTRKKFIPDDGSTRFYNYEITEDGNLIRWHNSEERADAEVLDYSTYGLFLWNEYVYYMKGVAQAKFRIDGIEGDSEIMVCLDGENIQIYGNDEYLFFIIDGMVKLYHVPSGNGEEDIVDIGIDSTNFTIYDNRSFLWKDSEGNTHYYDMDASSELPIPEDAILWEDAQKNQQDDTDSGEMTLAELFESEKNERLVRVNYDDSLGVVRGGQCAITMQDYSYGAVNGQGEIIVPHEYATCGYFVSPEGYFYLRGKFGEDAGFDNHYFNANGEKLLAADGSSVVAEDTVIYEIRDVWGKESTKIVAFDLKTKEEWFRYETGGNKEVTFTQMQDGVFYFLDRNSCELFKVSRNGTKELVHVFDDALYIHSSMITKDYMLLINQYDIAVGTEVDFVLYNIATEEIIKVDFCDFFIEKYPNFWENYDTGENYSNALLENDHPFNGGYAYHSGTVSVWTYYNHDTKLTDYYLMDLSKAKFDEAGKVINWDEVCLLESDKIEFSITGFHYCNGGYIDNSGQQIDKDYKEVTLFTHGYALVLDNNGMAYFIDTEFNKVSNEYPAEHVRNGNSHFKIYNGDEVLQIAVVE
ncbi:MAG: hypothetical protein IJX86_12525 [Lachnospiraceae bacterium]|nr:hypothetical protein [Lachnospiraceae bacterium]